MDTQSNKPLNQTWQAQVRQVAARNPKLARVLWRARQTYFVRFAYYYRQLSNLPRKFRRKFMKRLATTVAGAALLLALGQALPARAATITVDGVTCTLAEAITSANTDTAVGGCAAGSGADMIDLQTDVTLSTPLPPITSEIILEGHGHFLDGNSAYRILNVQLSGNLTLNEATLMHGYIYEGGAGILNEGVVTLNNCSLESNHSGYYGRGGAIRNKAGGLIVINDCTLRANRGGGGGGIWNDGTAVINDSLLTSNRATAEFFGGGGNIRNSGTFTVNNTTIRNGWAFTGGGIINTGPLTINNSTLSGNIAETLGGGLSTYDDLVVINNSTLSNNTTGYHGGAVRNYGGTVILSNTTVSQNSGGYAGGGIQNILYGTIILDRSLISGNSAEVGAEINNSATVITNQYNVIGYGGDPRTVGFTPGLRDIVPSGALNTVLDRNLKDNGGPTLTHALVLGSPAIDIALDEQCSVSPINGLDQRGYARNVDGNGASSRRECDAGAFEFNLSISPTPTPPPHTSSLNSMKGSDRVVSEKTSSFAAIWFGFAKLLRLR